MGSVGRGTAMQNFCHGAPFQSGDTNDPSNAGTEHLARSGDEVEDVEIIQGHHDRQRQ